MGIWAIVIGVILIGIGLFELHAARKAFVGLKQHGGPGTSPFIGYALWTGLLIGVILIIVGIVTATQFR